MTSTQAADSIPHKSGRTRAQFIAAVCVALVKAGERAIPAQYDNRGDCFTCGECGRCPGYHTEAEERASINRARARMASSVAVALDLPGRGSHGP